MTTTARVLLVDDQPETKGLLPETYDVRLLGPGDENFNEYLSQNIHDCDLVLIDHELQLDDRQWLKAVDGAALVGNFRSHARKMNISLPPLVLITADQHAYANEIPAVGPAVPLSGTFLKREHRLAPTLDVEWILAKGDPSTPEKIVQLSEASIAARDVIAKSGATLDEIEHLLRRPNASTVPWAELGAEHVRRARPPISEDASSMEHIPRGPANVLRWLLQRVLPYPGLMLSDLYAAWTLKVTCESFSSLLADLPRNEWTEHFVRAKYDGVLSSFFGRRWWAAGVEHAAWQLNELANEKGGLQPALDEIVGKGRLAALPLQDPVVVWTEELVEDQMWPIEDAVQIHPPGWPAEAMEPWMRRDDVRSDTILQSMIDPNDLLALTAKAGS